MLNNKMMIGCFINDKNRILMMFTMEFTVTVHHLL